MTTMETSCFIWLLLFLSIYKCTTTAVVTPSKPSPTEPFSNVWQLDNHDNYWLFWKTNGTHITFETHVKTKGYVGFGLSTNGKMFPSDVVVGWVDNQGLTHFKDCHTDGHFTPIIDASQDWFLLLGKEDDFGTVLKFVRKLDTCDDEDHTITDNTLKVIYSYHPNDPTSFASMSYHGSERRGAKSLMLLSSVKANEYVPPPEAHEFHINHHSFHVPSTDTTYQCRVFKVPHLAQKYHMIRYEPVITPGNENYVHHILVYNCPTATDSDVGHTYHCYNNKPAHLKCNDVIIAWAVGGVAFDFPPNVGFSFNAPGDPRYLVMETHYNNPTLKSGIIDSSGFKIIATPKIRQYDAGMLETGAIVNRMQFVPPHEPNFLSRHYCSEGCLQKALKTQDNTMKVFAVLLHAHLLGKKIRARHIRGDTELEPLSEDLTYDFDFQDFRIFSKEREIRYGDRVTVDCYYDSSQRSNPTTGGLSTSEEMCLAFLYYYPKHNISSCLSEPLYSQMGSNPNHNIHTLSTWNWNDKTVRDNFQGMLTNTTFYHRCHGDNNPAGHNWRRDMSYEHEPSKKYIPTPRQCPSH